MAHHSRLQTDLICVIGAGIGGLAAAVALQMDGANVQVFERDEAFDDRKQGYGLTLTNNPVGPLASLGILDLVKEWDDNKAPSNRHWIFKSDGSLLGYYGQDFDNDPKVSRNMTNRGNLRIPRQELRRALMNKLLPNTIHWGKDLKSIELIEKRDSVSIGNNDVRVSFHDAVDTVECSLVIGADGIRSRTRSILEPDNHSVYTGVFIVLGITPYKHPLLHEGGFYTLDGENRLFTMPYNKEQSMWQLSFRLDNEEEAKAMTERDNEERGEFFKNHVLARCASWHAPVTDLISATDFRDIWGTPLYDRMPCSLKKGVLNKLESKVTLLGDAAHPMTPFKGQGANQALNDAVKLARQLKKSKVSSALKNYEREMVNASSTKVKDSREAAKFLHSPQVLRMSTAVLDHDSSGKKRSHGEISQVPFVNEILKFSNISDTFLHQFIQRLQKENVNADVLSQNKQVEAADSEVQEDGKDDLVSAVFKVINEMEVEKGSIRKANSKWKKERKLK